MAVKSAARSRRTSGMTLKAKLNKSGSSHSGLSINLRSKPRGVSSMPTERKGRKHSSTAKGSCSGLRRRAGKPLIRVSYTSESPSKKIRMYCLESRRRGEQVFFVHTLCQMEKVYTRDVRLMQPSKTITWHGPVKFDVGVGPINTSY